MKYNVKKTFELDFTLDSSEAVMFDQGGKHKVEIPYDVISQIDEESKVFVSFQLHESEQARYRFVNKPKV